MTKYRFKKWEDGVTERVRSFGPITGPTVLPKFIMEEVIEIPSTNLTGFLTEPNDVPIPGVTARIEVLNPDNTTTTVPVTTETDGSYSVDYEVTQVGDYVATFIWEGNAEYNGCEGSVVFEAVAAKKDSKVTIIAVPSVVIIP